MENVHNKCLSCPKKCSQSYIYKTPKGLTTDIVCQISGQKNEPNWMLELRLKAFETFKEKKFPKWGPNLEKLNLNDIYFYLKPLAQKESCWQNVPSNITQNIETEKLQKNEKYLGGLGFQYESEVVYHNLKKDLEKQGVIFTDSDTALQKYPDLFKKYFRTVVPIDDNKFAALNTAVWSGGSFIYVPKNVKVTIPLQAYYRIDAEKMGQFERTLIIADEGSQVSYIEGCSAPNYSTNSLHGAIVEIIAHKDAKVRYYTIQNWSKNVYNLVTKRAIAHQDAVVKWVDCNIGSSVTRKYPAVVLAGKGAKTEILSFAIADKNQIQDSGAKAIHLASNTSSKIHSKSISSHGGRNSFRGTIKIVNQAKNCKSYMQCDSILMDEHSRADSYPYLEISEKTADVGHEARVSKIADEKLFYLMSRGISLQCAQTLIINGFAEPITKELPPEYAIEINRLIETQIKKKE